MSNKKQDVLWVYQQMDLDRFFRRLSDAEKEYFIEKAIRFSLETADQFAERFGRDYSYDSLRQAAERLGCRVQILSGHSPCPFLSDFDPGKRRITLYEQNIKTFYDRVKEDYPSCFLKYDLREMCMLHEVCHVLEFDRFGDIGKLAGSGEKRRFLRGFREYRRLSEIAAHLFVQRLMDLPVSPALFGVAPEAQAPKIE